MVFGFQGLSTMIGVLREMIPTCHNICTCVPSTDEAMLPPLSIPATIPFTLGRNVQIVCPCCHAGVLPVGIIYPIHSLLRLPSFNGMPARFLKWSLSSNTKRIPENS